MMVSPPGPTGSICLRPPYRLPMPAARMRRVGVCIGARGISGRGSGCQDAFGVDLAGELLNKKYGFPHADLRLRMSEMRSPVRVVPVDQGRAEEDLPEV